MNQLIDKLNNTHSLTLKEWQELIEHRTPESAQYLFECARKVRQQYYGNHIFIRGLIEFTNYCHNDCYYCGIRKGNHNIHRYRLTEDQIMECCEVGYQLGFRTFVLQGGEDSYFTESRMVSIITSIRSLYPDCAITLSIGERSRESYQAFFDAGADRYLLRHETYDAKHYSTLHPPNLTATHRQKCLMNLKEIGYQVGTGFMVGSPFQTATHLAKDMLFLEQLQPHMVGIGPFISHHDTPFSKKDSGSAALTLYMLGLIRLLLPKTLLPATTALGSIADDGRERGILAGANVIMPNLSPANVRADYSLYDNKLYSGSEAAESLTLLKEQMEAINYQIITNRGDSLM
ncbi:[FeFe] hydrogenase H-cluster radical SAM maturase HydE [Lachnospiraceae bacterium OttesenSCG-928-E19]|nr:[FeFe] hydrogenase H-cluster radical SAM maturase HydE [Lachnospiraceae bacterium OttesenSCG-928-E19]